MSALASFDPIQTPSDDATGNPGPPESSSGGAKLHLARGTRLDIDDGDSTMSAPTKETRESSSLPRKSYETHAAVEPRWITVSPPSSRVVVLQKWEGIVEEIDEAAGEFSVVVRDLINPDAPNELITMSIAEVPPPDLDLLVPGAVFYWSMGYEDFLDGQRKRSSSIRFRRLPQWRGAEITKARKEAAHLRDELDWR